MSKIPIYPYDFVVRNRMFWFYHTKINALFCFEPDRGMRYVASISNNRAMFDDVSYFKVLEESKKLFFIPYDADVLFEYSLDDGKILELELPDDYKSTLKFIDAYIFEDNLYCVPLYSSMDLLRYSISNRKCYIENSWKNFVSSISTHLDTGTRLNDDVFCAVIYKTNKLALFNMRNHTTKIIEFEFVSGVIHSCVCIDNNLYLSEMGSEVIHIVDVRTMKKVGELRSKYSGFRIYRGSNKYLAVSPFGKDEDIELYDVSTGENRIIELKKTGSSRDIEYPGGSLTTDENGRLFYYDRKSNEMIDLSTNMRYSFVYDNRDFPKLYSNIWKRIARKGEIIKETPYFGLEEFVFGQQ